MLSVGADDRPLVPIVSACGLVTLRKTRSLRGRRARDRYSIQPEISDEIARVLTKGPRAEPPPQAAGSADRLAYVLARFADARWRCRHLMAPSRSGSELRKKLCNEESSLALPIETVIRKPVLRTCPLQSTIGGNCVMAVRMCINISAPWTPCKRGVTSRSPASKSWRCVPCRQSPAPWRRAGYGACAEPEATSLRLTCEPRASRCVLEALLIAIFARLLQCSAEPTSPYRLFCQSMKTR